MNRWLLGILLILTHQALGQKRVRDFDLPPGVTTKNYVANKIIVKFKTGTIENRLSKSSSLLKSVVIQSVSIDNIKQLFPSNTNQQRISADEKHNLEGIVEITYTSSTKSIEQVINEILKDPTVEYAEPRYIYRSYSVPNDAANQPYLAQIHAPEAWNIAIGAVSPIIIAIVDSGSQLNHPDLANNIEINLTDPINGIDDDHDGYIDNYQGWDFVGAHLNAPQGDNNPNVTNALNGHGIHVSGIASAVTDNGQGIASTALNYAKLLIVKVGADDNSEAILYGYEGIKYAVDHGAKIINCSWGGTSGGSFGQDIINYALDRDCLVIAAAGNDNVKVVDYPGAYSGVIAVASVSSGDQKSYFSSYGQQVSISAPGENVLSTYYNNTYTNLSGTSMATPVVSSAAALVKAKFPTFTMQQVADQLLATTDNIESQNLNYAGFLGTGRLNVYRALTEVPTIRIQKITVQDNEGGSIPAGNTAQLFFDLKNFTVPISQLSIQLASTNPNVSVPNVPVIVNNINTLETKTLIGPFEVYVNSTVSDNQIIRFNLNYSWGSSSSTESFNLPVARDYINIEVNNIATSITNKGRVGYSDSEHSYGLGFLYNGTPLMYESALMIGNSPTKVSNNARNTTNNTYDEDFAKRIGVRKIANSTAAFEATCEFDDSNSSSPFNIYVTHSQTAYSASPDNKYTIVKYKVQNKNSLTLSGIYIGLFGDFDISSNGLYDATQYDAANRMGYIYSKMGNNAFAGIKLLSRTSSPAYYPLSYNVTDSPLRTFSIADKYKTLSSGIQSLGLGNNTTSGYDVSFVLGEGPFTLAPESYVEVAFAFIGGDSLNDLQTSALAAQNQYNQQAVSPSINIQFPYPNPSDTSTTISFSIPRQGQTTIKLYNSLGKLIKEVLNNDLPAGLHNIKLDELNNLSQGLYIYTINYENTIHSFKLQVGK